MPAIYCIVCGGTADIVNNIFLHKIPKDANRVNEWAKILFDKEIEMQNFIGKKICSRHFPSTGFIGLRLSKYAFPLPYQHYYLNENSTNNVQHILEKEHDYFIPQRTIIKDSITVLEDLPISNYQPLLNEKQRAFLYNKLEKLKELHNKSSPKDILEYVIIDFTMEGLNNSTIEIISGINKQMLKSLIKSSKQAPEGHTWSANELSNALLVYQKTPEYYALLRNIHILPPLKMLHDIRYKFHFKAGINERLINHLSKCILFNKTRHCVLMFDYMKITQNVRYDKATDEVFGLENLCGQSGQSTGKIANRALVFIIRGLNKPWQQPIAYYFIWNKLDAFWLSSIIKNVLTALQKYRFRVLATVSNASKENRTAVKVLGATKEKPFYTVNKKQIVHVYDFKDLMNCTRNLWTKYDIKYEIEHEGKMSKGIAKWSYVENTVKKCNDGVPSMFKVFQALDSATLKDGDLDEIFSQKMAAYVSREKNLVDTDVSSMDTALFVLNLGMFCDSVIRKNPDSEYRCRPKLNKNQIIIFRQQKLWRRQIDMVNSLVYLKKTGSPCKKIPATHNCWLQSLRALVILVDNAATRNYHFPVFSFTLKSLHDLLDAVKFTANVNEPTAYQFVNALKTQILSNFYYRPSTNDPYNPVKKILSNCRSFVKQFVSVAPKKTNIRHKIDYSKCKSIRYISGYIVYRVLQTNSCPICYDELVWNCKFPRNCFASCKDYKTIAYLFNASLSVRSCVKKVSILLKSRLRGSFKAGGISSYFFNYLSDNLNLRFRCSKHNFLVRNEVIRCVLDLVLPHLFREFSNSLKRNKQFPKTLKVKRLRSF